MRDHLVSNLRLIGFSVCALAVALCMRVAPAQAAPLAPEPRFTAPPPENTATLPVALTEEEQVNILDVKLTALSAEIADLTAALEVLGPLPDHPELFIPVMLAEREAPAAAKALRYAPVARSADSLGDLPHAGLGALAGFPRFAADLGATASYDAAPHNVLLGRDLANDASIAALCVELSALAGAPRVAAAIRGW